MSSAHGANPVVQKSVSFGILIILTAFLYQYKGWNFLSSDIHLSTKPSITEYKNDSDIPGNQYFKVTYVTDGDTVHINLNGVDENVRLLGINTPELLDTKGNAQCSVVEASKRMKQLADGENVRLETDSTQGVRDAYGRILAYVYLEDGQMLNRKMIAEGYAYEYTYLEPYKYRSEFRSVQNIAKASKRGLWADDACHGQLDVTN